MASIGRGGARRLRKIGAHAFWIASGSVVFVLCGRILWLAFRTHSILIPLRRSGGRSATLDQEPAFFSASVTIYAIIFLFSPIGVVTLIGELIEEVRAHRRARRGKQI